MGPYCGVRSMSADLYLTIDIGTGSVRAALVDFSGAVLRIAGREHEQIVPAFGWFEQHPEDWWTGAAHLVREAIGFIGGAAGRIAVVCACGQNHGTVLIDEFGALTWSAAPLWNDKPTVDLVAAFEAKYRPEMYLDESGNPPATAWPAFKLQWLRDNDRRAYDAATTAPMPDEPECGVIGRAAIAATATGQFSRLSDALDTFVRYAEEISPDHAWAERYQEMQGVFEHNYRHSQELYDLDTLA